MKYRLPRNVAPTQTGPFWVSIQRHLTKTSLSRNVTRHLMCKGDFYIAGATPETDSH